MTSKKTEIQENIILKIKKLRNQHNLSQEAIADLLGISNGQMGNIESPKYKHKYTLKQLNTICIHLGYPIEKLFLNEDELVADNRIEIFIKRFLEYDK